ncbi:MAG: hypothetical protein HYY44_02445 [Deltaproteobacteria bacterium]|nr:hypothetical protein [Deltaproteobacteria bacterium]
MRWGGALAVVVCLFLPQPVFAEVGPIYEVIDQLVENLGRDLKEPAGKTSRTAVVSITSSNNIDGEVREYLLAQIESLRSEGEKGFGFLRCQECLNYKAETVGDRVVVQKGGGSQEELVNMISRLGVDSYTRINLVHSGRRTVLTLTIHKVEDHSIIWDKRYSTRLLYLTQKGLKASLTGYQLVTLPEKTFPLGIEVVGGERLYGVGEIGVYVFGSMLTKSPVRSYVSVGPSLALNLNELFSRPWSWGSLSWTVRGGFGIYGAERDVTIGSGIKAELGSFVHVKVEEIKGFSIEGAGSQPLTILIGFGFDIG